MSKQANHVWCVDITYIPMQKGFLYLVAVMDWATRHVLSWRLSNTMEAAFCVEALKKYGPPKIFNTDQGSQTARFRGIDRRQDRLNSRPIQDRFRVVKCMKCRMIKIMGGNEKFWLADK